MRCRRGPNIRAGWPRDRQSKRTRLQPGQQTAIDRYLDFADRYKASKNLDEALKSVLDAEALLQKSLAAGDDGA